MPVLLLTAVLAACADEVDESLVTTSGCNIGGVAYCQKFWPGASGIRQVSVSSKADNVWKTAGCGPVFEPWDGDDEFECLD